MKASGWQSAACLIAALIALGAGYAILNPWLAAPVLVFAGLTIAVHRRDRPDWLPTVLLVGGIIAAAGGVLRGVSPRLMLAAAGLLLAGWELASRTRQPFDNLTLGGGRLSGWSGGRLLLFSVGGGLLVAEAGLGIQVNLPFGVVLLAALVVIFCLYGFSRVSSKIPD